VNKKAILYILLSAIVIAILAGFFSSSLPDGLEKVLGSSGQKAYSFATVIFGIILIYFIFRSIAKVKHIGDLLKKLMNMR